MKWVIRILLALLLLLGLGAAIAFFWLRSSKPTYQAELDLPGLVAPVKTYFDEFGVPHIYASDKHDLYMAFGYIHAQDRLFQMEMMRRAGGGRLAEIFGKPLLKVDRMFRTLGLTEYAAESAAYMETQSHTAMYADIKAYLEGVNYFLHHGPTPPEFSIVGIEKRAFTIEDMYLITGAMSFSFSQAQKTEPVVDFIAKNLSQIHLSDLGLLHDSTETYIRSNTGKPQEPTERTPDSVNGHAGLGNNSCNDALLAWSKECSAVLEVLPFAPLEGSNAWVISGQKTKNKQVIFCNDTHIGYMLPQTWYEAHLNAPGFEMYGHFLGGIPFALVGRNRDLSWGLTMLLNDDMDFYAEQLNPDNNDEVWSDGAWRPLEEKTHKISIKGESDTTILVRYSKHGPIVNDAFDHLSQSAPISMFWTYTALENRTVDAFYGLNNSKTIEEFESYLPAIHAPGLNINYGDAKGNIAWWATARLMKRPTHVNSWTVLNGATGEDDLLGYYDFAENPRCINPTWGYIYSANDWPEALKTENGTELWYPGYYKPQDRADRIRHLLEKKNDWDMQSIQTVMNDHTNTANTQLLNAWQKELWKVKSYRDSTYFRQFDELFDWDGSYDTRNSSPTFFNAMLYHVMRYAMADELGLERFHMFLQTHQAQRTQNLLIKKGKSPWWDDVSTDLPEKREDIIYKAYLATVAQLREKYGSNPQVWNWRKACSLELKHPLSAVALLKPIFNIGPNPTYGGNETILQSGFTLDRTAEYKVYFGSQMRIIVDFAQTDSSLNITPSGNSGHVMSKHYSDQADRYRNRLFRPQWMNKEKIERFPLLLLK